MCVVEADSAANVDAEEKRRLLANVRSPDDGDSTILVVRASCQDANYNRYGDDAGEGCS